jgi:hypothetical protein
MATMYILDSTTKTLKANLDAAIATTNPDFTVAYADTNGSVFTEGSSDGTLNGTTNVVICSAPQSGYRRVIKSITIMNRDSAAVSVNLKYDNNGSIRVAQRVTLASNEVFTLDGVYDTIGNLRTNNSMGYPYLAGVTSAIYKNTTNTINISGGNFMLGPATVRFVFPSATIDSAVTITNTVNIANFSVPSAVTAQAAGTAGTIQVIDLYGRASNTIALTVADAPSGGTITTSGTDRIHAFYTSGTFVSNVPLTVRYLVVGGGGGGGSDMGGGGGAGGYLASTNYTLPAGTYTITVGSGGAGGPAGAGQIAGANGTNSSIVGTGVNIVALGGGGGGSRHDSSGAPATTGGSGGGGSGQYAGALGTTGQGNNGANSAGQWYPGGGGGAGAAGSVGPGTGGVGVSNDILGTAYFWAGGGGGAGYSGSGGNGGNGGGGGGAVNTTVGGSGLNQGAPGGGGSTGSQTNTPGGNAGANTGGGGGGGSHYNSGNKGGNGGSGIVVLRFAFP